MAKIYIGNQEISGSTKYESVSANTKELQPNVLYDFGDRGATSGETITLTFANAPLNQASEYMWQVLVDENSLALTIPSGIKWMENDNVSISGTTATLTSKYTYQFSVLNGIGLIVSVENGTLDAPTLSLNGSVLSWDAITNATSYKIESGANSTTQTATSFDLSTWYSTLGTLGTPTNLTPTSTTNSITISWDSVSNAGAYTIYYKKSDASTYTSVTSATNSITITGLTSGTSYDIYVKANSVNDMPLVYVKAMSNTYIDNESSTLYSYTKYSESANSSTITTSTQAGS